MLNQSTPFYLFVLAIMTGLTLPVLIQDGMFMDAVLYTSVAHNQSEGFGTFWFPQFSMHNVFGQDAFHEQPPLGFWIMSIPFRFFDDSMYIERIYTFFMMLVNAWLIILFWRKINAGSEFRNMGWLPVFFWITIPQVFWSFSNNMLENTMSALILGAAIFIYDACTGTKINIFKLIISALFIFCSTLVKGIPGLFVLSIPGLLWLITRKINLKQAFIATAFISICVAALYCLLLLHAPARESLRTYFFDRALFRIGENPTVDSRFYILGSLIQQLTLQLLICIVIYLISRSKQGWKTTGNQIKLAVFFIALGLCGSLPLMLTLVQKAFYYVPSLPFFAIGFAIFVAPSVANTQVKIMSNKNTLIIAYILSCMMLFTAIGFSVAQIGKTSRNKEILSDIHTMGKFIPDHSCVTVPQNLWNDWHLQTYMMRNYSICLDPSQSHKFYISKADSLPKKQEFTKLILRGKKYDLYSNN